jgi:hypothetical protein
MKQNKNFYFIGLIFILTAIVTTVLIFRGHEYEETIPVFLGEVFKTSSINIGKEMGQYLINGKEYYAKEIFIGETRFFLIVENYQSEAGIYRFYSSSSTRELLKEIESLIPIRDSNQVFEKNLFLRDITNDGIEEIFIKKEVSSNNTSSYEILKWDDTNSFSNIKLEKQEDFRVDFDEIFYKDGHIYITWHGSYEKGRVQYKLDKNNLVEIKSTGIYQLLNSENSCEIREKEAGYEEQIIDTKPCDLVWENFGIF